MTILHRKTLGLMQGHRFTKLCAKVPRFNPMNVDVCGQVSFTEMLSKKLKEKLLKSAG